MFRLLMSWTDGRRDPSSRQSERRTLPQVIEKYPDDRRLDSDAVHSRKM